MSADEPRASGLLNDDGQSLYWEEWGSPDGLAALYLHGGPGGGLGRSGYRNRFDLGRYRVVGLDQRGCGRSVPLAGSPGHDLARNNTPRLIADIEAVREERGIDAWVVNGVSWGSTLALAYAQAHPERVLGIVLMAATTTRPAEVHWITEGVAALYPEAWDRLAAFVGNHDPGFRRAETPLIDALARLMGRDDPELRAATARAWGEWEDWHVSIGAGGYRPDERWADPSFAVPFLTLVAHYWSHHGFCEPPILERMDLIADVPGRIIHGRLDVSGPVGTAWLLHRRWPASTLKVIEDEGHGGPRMVDAWSRANADLADLVRRR